MTHDDERVSRIPAMADLEQARADVETAEALREEARERMYHAVLTIPYQIDGAPETREQAIRHLYWFHEDVNVRWIAEAFDIKASDVYQIAGKASLELTCTRCNAPFMLTVTSRHDLREKRGEMRKVRKGRPTIHRFLCQTCGALECRQLEKEWQARDAARKARLEQLRTMPYHEYLQTPEWQERRTQHLRSAGHRCQVCNAANVSLHVHHRTYERRGDERFKDLVVLCEDCHRIFHEQGRLAV